MATSFVRTPRTARPPNQDSFHPVDFFTLFFSYNNEANGEPRHFGAPPTASSVLQSLPLIHVTAHQVEAMESCAVCMCVFDLKEQANMLPCGHMFHTSCIEPWLKEHCSCPNCRYELPSVDANYEAVKKEMRSNERAAVDDADDGDLYDDDGEAGSPEALPRSSSSSRVHAQGRSHPDRDQPVSRSAQRASHHTPATEARSVPANSRRLMNSFDHRAAADSSASSIQPRRTITDHQHQLRHHGGGGHGPQRDRRSTDTHTTSTQSRRELIEQLMQEDEPKRISSSSIRSALADRRTAHLHIRDNRTLMQLYADAVGNRGLRQLLDSYRVYHEDCRSIRELIDRVLLNMR